MNLRSIRGNGSAGAQRQARPPRVTEGAIDKIRERIVSGAWGPGDRLPKESELAAELGLSRNSLREAVRALSQLRVLEVRQGDGTVIARAAGNAVLTSLLASLATRTMRARLWHGREADGALNETRDEHRRIYEAIMAGDPELARANATAHIASSERWLKGQLRAGKSA